MQFLSNKEEEMNEQEELKEKLINAQKGQVKCRLCKEDHWTKKCPYKDKLEPLRTSLLVSSQRFNFFQISLFLINIIIYKKLKFLDTV